MTVAFPVGLTCFQRSIKDVVVRMLLTPYPTPPHTIYIYKSRKSPKTHRPPVEAPLAARTILETGFAGLVNLKLWLLSHCRGLPHLDQKDLQRDTEMQG